MITIAVVNSADEDLKLQTGETWCNPLVRSRKLNPDALKHKPTGAPDALMGNIEPGLLARRTLFCAVKMLRCFLPQLRHWCRPSDINIVLEMSLGFLESDCNRAAPRKGTTRSISWEPAVDSKPLFAFEE